jgi:hypothetical protein
MTMTFYKKFKLELSPPKIQKKFSIQKKLITKRSINKLLILFDQIKMEIFKSQNSTKLWHELNFSVSRPFRPLI